MKTGFFVYMLAALAGGLPAATITSLQYGTSAGGESTIPGDTLAAIGVTAAGGTSNPFLNDTNTKAINIGFGNYLTFNETFFGAGDALTIDVIFSDATSASTTVTVPASGTVATLSGGGGTITISTTSLAADRMNFGNAPGTFNGNGVNDTIYSLDFTTATAAAAPEPAGGWLLLAGLAPAAWVVWRRRRGAVRG